MKIAMALCAVGAMTSPALADPATHALRLWSEQITGDNAPGQVNPVCRIRGELHNLQKIASPPISVAFWHKHPGVDGLTNSALIFGSLPAGGRETVDAYVNGMRCRDIRVERSEANFQASGLPFIKISVGALGAPRLRAQTLFAERDPLSR